MGLPGNRTDYCSRARRARPPIKDSSSKPKTEARAWGILVKKRKVTVEQARRDIGVSPRQVRTVDSRWHEYRNRVLEEFNKLYPAEDFVLESTTAAEHHRPGNGGDVIFNRRPEAVSVRMLVGITGLADPQIGFDKDWSFEPGQIVEIDARRAEVWQSTGKCVILTAEEAKRARREASAAPQADARGLADVIRSGRCSVCDGLAELAFDGEAFCRRCYSREIFLTSAAR